jgi:hypothetical protein
MPVTTPLVDSRDSVAALSSKNSLMAAKVARLNRFDPIAQTRRADSQRRQNAARKAWKPAERPEGLDEKFFRTQIQPRLAAVTVPIIVTTLSVSEPYATRIRAGRCVPHPRHWLALARLVGAI